MTYIRIPHSIKRALLVVGSLVIAGLVATNVVLASATDNFFGYAWSTNVGWIKVNNCESATDCTGQGYGLRIATSGGDRRITGYAWSPNIGWITFNTYPQTPWDPRQSGDTDEQRLALRCPVSTGPDCGVYANFDAPGTDAPLRGWARACSVYANNCDPSRGVKPDWMRGGWDGWISLGDTNPTDGINYGVKINKTTGSMSGYAWGSGVVGWVDFSGVSNTIIDQCPITPPAPLPGGFINNCQTCNPGDPCWCEKYPGDPLCVAVPPCPNPVNGQCPNDPGDPNDPNNPPGCPGGPSGGPTGGGCGTDQCTNIPPEYEPANILPPYRQLSDGRCLCIPGYVLNAQYQCVKPVYVEPKQ